MSLATELREAIGSGADPKKAKRVAEAIAKAIRALGWDVKVAQGVQTMRGRDTDGYTVWWPGARGSTMSLKVFVVDSSKRTGEIAFPSKWPMQVNISYWSDNHHLRGMQFDHKKTRSEVPKLIKSLHLEKKKEGPAPSAPSGRERVSRFLRGVSLGPAGRARSIDVIRGGDGWSIEPTNRQRLDHYVGSYYDPGPDDDPEGWDQEGWDEDYAEPIHRALQPALDREFGQGMLSIDVGDKGHVFVYLTAKGKKALG